MHGSSMWAYLHCLEDFFSSFTHWYRIFVRLRYYSQEDSFGLCLGSASSPGVLTLGGPDASFYTGNIHYTSIMGTEGYYSVDFSAIGINGQEVCSGAQCTGAPPSGDNTWPIVDSGTCAVSAVYCFMLQLECACMLECNIYF